MSDDLISKKWLMKQFVVSEDGRRIPEYDCDNFPITISIKDVKDIIRKAPIAFDKEKMIEQIKSNVSTVQGIAYSEYTSGFSYGYYAAVMDAVEIVEKGGIE